MKLASHLCFLFACCFVYVGNEMGLSNLAMSGLLV